MIKIKRGQIVLIEAVNNEPNKTKQNKTFWTRADSGNKSIRESNSTALKENMAQFDSFHKYWKQRDIFLS